MTNKPVRLYDRGGTLLRKLKSIIAIYLVGSAITAYVSYKDSRTGGETKSMRRATSVLFGLAWPFAMIEVSNEKLGTIADELMTAADEAISGVGRAS